MSGGQGDHQPDETRIEAMASCTGGGAGCGWCSRDALELAALAIVDNEVPVPEGVNEHVQQCLVCRAIVERLCADNAFLGEFKVFGEVRPEHQAIDATMRASDTRRLMKTDDTADGGDAGTHAQRSASARLSNPASHDSFEQTLEQPIQGYRLGAELQRGGQGAVYLAEQLATRRTCAVKMLLSGRFATERQRQRFEREIEVVARLRHRSIVTLYESGISRGNEPWFAMEYVEGERLDTFIANNTLTTRAMIALFHQIADAVAYAHRRGVIHRDLKPGNILVDKDGVARILDFGLARSTEQSNAGGGADNASIAGEFLGTFAYAAPEQLGGDPSAIDSRCDLYALGVVFYECLTQRRPFEGARSIAELVAQKTTHAPPSPSRVRRDVDRNVDRDVDRNVDRNVDRKIDHDIDIIVLRLLAPDPARRYDTADALAEDLTRFLDGRPIIARADSITYVLRTNVRRHWIASSAASALLFTIVASGIALAFAYAHAQRERVRSERTLQSFRDAVGSVNPETSRGSADISVDQFLELIEQNAVEELRTEPRVLAGVLDTIGLVHLGFEDVPLATRALELALLERRALASRGEATAVEVAESLHSIGRLRLLERRTEDAEFAYREALAIRIADLGADDRLTLLTERHLASCLRRQGKLDEALALFDDAWSRAENQSDVSETELAAIRNGRAFVYLARGESTRALTEFEAALATIVPILAHDDYRIGRSLYNCAMVEETLARSQAALEHATQALDILRKRKGGDAATVVEVERMVARLRLSGGGG